MHVSSKVLIASQFVSSLIIVALVSHASSFDRPYFGASPTVILLLLLTTAQLFLSFFILMTALSSDKLYETPLICLHGLSFFVLLVIIGILSIIESIKFESLEEKEIGIAGALAIFTAFTTIIGCGVSYNLWENLQRL